MERIQVIEPSDLRKIVLVNDEGQFRRVQIVLCSPEFVVIILDKEEDGPGCKVLKTFWFEKHAIVFDNYAPALAKWKEVCEDFLAQGYIVNSLGV